MLDIIDKTFKPAIVNMSKELKDIVLKELSKI